MSEIELLPCPFCGGEAVVHVNDGVRVICRNCSATTKILVDGFSQGKPNGSAIKSVIKAWNTRKPMEWIVEQLEEELNLADKEKERCARENKLQFDRAKSYAHGISIAIEIVKQAEAEYNGGWIPCDGVHFPEENVYVRVTTWTETEKIGFRRDGKWFVYSSDGMEEATVLAWQPTQPYQPKGEHDENTK